MESERKRKSRAGSGEEKTERKSGKIEWPLLCFLSSQRSRNLRNRKGNRKKIEQACREALSVSQSAHNATENEQTGS
jgi:hypothetical protein